MLVGQTQDLAQGAVTRLIFYGKANYATNPTVYQQNVQINTPLSADAKGNLYFGFLVLGPTPIKLVSGLARIAANGTGSWASAAAISGDTTIDSIAMSCAPALSTDGKTVYVATTNSGDSHGYLVAVNSSTLAPIRAVRLLGPSSGLDAQLNSSSSATPTGWPGRRRLLRRARESLLRPQRSRLVAAF